MKIGFLTIPTTSVDRSIQFYQDVLGFLLINKFSPQAGVTIAFMHDGHDNKVEFIERGEKVNHSNCLLSIGFEVENIEAIRNHLHLHNVDVLSGPTELPNGALIMQAKEINGVTLGFIQHRRRTTAV